MALNDLVNRKESISVFWGLSILLVVIGMFYLGLHGFFDQNVAEFFVFGITVMMLLVSIVLTQFDIFFLEKSFEDSAFGWLVGFIMWFIIGLLGGGSSGSVTDTAVQEGTREVIKSNPQNILEATLGLITIKGSVLFSTIGDQIPSDWNFFLNNVVNPITEEAFFAVAIPVFILGIMKGGAKTHPAMKFLENPAVQVVVLLLLIPPAFAFFHVGKIVYGFIIAAIMFRSILTVLLWGDLRLNLIPFIVVLPSFLVGSHMGNNFGQEGISKTLSFLFTSAPGILTLAVFTIFTIGALIKPGKYVYKIVLS